MEEASRIGCNGYFDGQGERLGRGIKEGSVGLKWNSLSCYLGLRSPTHRPTLQLPFNFPTPLQPFNPPFSLPTPLSAFQPPSNLPTPFQPSKFLQPSNLLSTFQPLFSLPTPFNLPSSFNLPTPFSLPTPFQPPKLLQPSSSPSFPLPPPLYLLSAIDVLLLFLCTSPLLALITSLSL